MDIGRYGPWALITGGSEGIGASLARKLAARGFKLALVARKPEPLAALAAELRGLGSEVRTLSADLSSADALAQVRTITDDIDVGLFVYNAGANSVRGNFVEIEPDYFRSLIALNITNLAEFTRHYGALMRERGRGGMINCGSTAAFAGSPALATYCGAKAFIRLWSEALWAECRPMGVDVLHIIMGFTATPAMGRLGYDLSVGDTPDDVAQDMIDHIADGPEWYVGGDRLRDVLKARSSLEDRPAIVLGGTIQARKG